MVARRRLWQGVAEGTLALAVSRIPCWTCKDSLLHCSASPKLCSLEVCVAATLCRSM